MRVLISGASGLVGSALASFLTARGDEISRLVRTPAPAKSAVFWNPESRIIESERLEDHDAVIHLAGESIAARRWTAKQKARILSSREQGTKLLCETLSRLRHPPRVVVSASAIGYYGNRGDEELDESSPGGSGFLPQVCQAWEAATEAAARAGIRVVRLRFGIILSAHGGALAKLLPFFRFGLGGRIGSGRQWMSWIAIDDVVECIAHVLQQETFSGPVNAVTPKPVTNSTFVRTLAGLLRRPALLPLPAFVVRLLLGEMADAMLLAGMRVVPRVLLASNYRFLFPDLDGALQYLLGKTLPLVPAQKIQVA